MLSGLGGKGTSRMELSGGKGRGPYHAERLADLLRQSPPPMLAELKLWCLPSNTPVTPLSHNGSKATQTQSVAAQREGPPS
jgi:hypothetical protein